MRIVLVRPRDPNNIGAAARAMANFGLDDLVVVAPWAPVWREARSAVGASRVLLGARAVETFEEAISDRVLVGGTTAATRRRVDRVVSPEAFATEARGAGATWARAALVFGNEKHGLAADELARCHTVVRIATAAGQPSMNLAAAVAVCCYELGRGTVGAPLAPARGERLASTGELEAFVAAAFPDRSRPVAGRVAAARTRLRSLLLRARATGADVQLLRGCLSPSQPESDNDSA